MILFYIGYYVSVNCLFSMKADPDYLEFLKLIAKPAEHLPSAEIQLERKEAEQSGLLLCSLTDVLTLLVFVYVYNVK